MATMIQRANLTAFATVLPATQDSAKFQRIFDENRHRVYALAFWMTDHEVAAEQLMHNTFCRAFAVACEPGPEAIDCALVAELRELFPLGALVLDEPEAKEVVGVRRNIRKTDLERAVVQVPHTERMVFLLHDVEGYPHSRIARILGLTREESQLALHQARIRIRNLLASMPR